MSGFGIALSRCPIGIGCDPEGPARDGRAGRSVVMVLRHGWHRILLLGALCAVSVCVNAAETPKEIDGLIQAVGRSGCQFERNGKWYEAAAAQSHLQRKYDWLRKRDAAGTAEQFIERAATRSSISGKAYHMRCGDQASIPASEWFERELRRQRGDGTR